MTEVEEQVRDYIVLYRAKEYTEDQVVSKILSIPGIRIEDPDQNVRRPDWREGDLLRGWDIAVKYLKEEYNFIKMLPKEEK